MLKIAQIAPLFESVPPKAYGGTERVVANLTNELVNQGYDVTLFASGDSITKAKLISSTPKSIREAGFTDYLAYHIEQLQDVMERAREFDLLHFHTDFLHFPVSRLARTPNITTLHGRLDIPELKRVYQKFNDMPVVSISNSQRAPLPMARWVGTVYHGLPLDQYQPGTGEGGYAVFVGRISPEKRVDRAIEIAGKVGMDIKIAAKVDNADKEYYEKEIKHLMNQPHVEFLGEVNEEEKQQLVGDAAVMLFPIDWPEPFGIVLIEAMACGTPVIAFNHGSVPEIITTGKTGFVVNDIEEATQALKNIDLIKRDECRTTFENRFSAPIMAGNYVDLYERLLDGSLKRSTSKPGYAKNLPLLGE